MNEVKTILLIGRTGNGKSTLANVLLGRRDQEGNFEEPFGESAGSVSKTRKVQVEEFEHEGVKYRIVDTVGVGDTSMSLDRVLRKLALMSYSIRSGLSQILFVTDGQLAKEAKSTYNLLKKVVFDNKVADYTTIVRTNFALFWDKGRFEEEKVKMIERSGDFRTLIEECGDEKLIYVDNPPINIKKTKLADLNKKRREQSREVLLCHLKRFCQGDYKPVNLEKLGSKIGEDMAKKEELKKSVWERNVWNMFKRGIWELDNKRLNKEITKKMLEHIGKIDPELKKTIQKELDSLNQVEEDEKDKIADWSLLDERETKEELKAQVVQAESSSRK